MDLKKNLPSTEAVSFGGCQLFLPSSFAAKDPPFEEHHLFQTGRLTTYALLRFVGPLSILLRRRCYGILVATGVMGI